MASFQLSTVPVLPSRPPDSPLVSLLWSLACSIRAPSTVDYKELLLCPYTPLDWKILRGSDVDQFAVWHAVALSKCTANT